MPIFVDDVIAHKFHDQRDDEIGEQLRNQRKTGGGRHWQGVLLNTIALFLLGHRLQQQRDQVACNRFEIVVKFHLGAFSTRKCFLNGPLDVQFGIGECAPELNTLFRDLLLLMLDGSDGNVVQPLHVWAQIGVVHTSDLDQALKAEHLYIVVLVVAGAVNHGHDEITFFGTAEILRCRLNAVIESSSSFRNQLGSSLWSHTSHDCGQNLVRVLSQCLRWRVFANTTQTVHGVLAQIHIQLRVCHHVAEHVQQFDPLFGRNLDRCHC
mmetsp:Transcript_5075/g.15497  ORF Transcript_5075/g.15497 Transcript_5075/m.15497 type:complete len:266 (+) Transcript_5075:1617-2414(+)